MYKGAARFTVQLTLAEWTREPRTTNTLESVKTPAFANSFILTSIVRTVFTYWKGQTSLLTHHYNFTDIVPSRPVPSRPVPSRPVPSRPVPSRPVPSRPVPSRPVPSRRHRNRYMSYRSTQTGIRVASLHITFTTIRRRITDPFHQLQVTPSSVLQYLTRVVPSASTRTFTSFPKVPGSAHTGEGLCLRHARPVVCTCYP